MTWVLLNEAAHHHKARERWKRVAHALPGATNLEIVTLDRAGKWREALARALTAGQRLVVAAGGDGTVGSLFDALYHLGGEFELDEITVGAVGLGSSNDFHKPYSRFIAGVPVRIDVTAATQSDLGLVRYLDATGASRERCFAVSASVGVVARANALFNQGSGSIGVLKARAPGVAIAAAALKAVSSNRNQTLRIGCTHFERTLPITNLSVSKTRHLAGSFTYDSQVQPDDGLLSVNLCADMSGWELVCALAALRCGHFQGRPKTLTMSIPMIAVSSEHRFELELDGEIVVTQQAEFRVLQRRARICA